MPRRLGIGTGLTRAPSPIGGGGGISSPDEIADLTFWLDPDDPATVTEAGGAGTGVSAIADKVGSVPVIQGNATRRPQVANSGGRNYLDFDGSDDWIYVDETTTIPAINFGAGDWTIVALAKSASNSGVVLCNKGGTTGGGRYLFQLSAFTPGDLRAVCGVTDTALVEWGPAEGDLGWNDGNPHVFAIQRDGSTGRAFYDGVALASTGDLSGVGNIDNAVSAGFVRDLILGAAQSGSFVNLWSDFQLGEFLIYKRALTAGEISNLQSYLSQKWGVA